MSDLAKTAGQQDMPPDARKMPSTFDPAYVQGAVKPFFRSSIYQGERPVLPMIDLALSKEIAMPAHLAGMLYDNWELNMEEGLTVFIQGYQKRGPHNERKRIYHSAVTPDLYGPMYSGKVKRFLDSLFDEQNEGKPLMHQYSQRYFDLYWDLHLGVTGDDIPSEVRQIGQSFVAVFGFRYPTLQVVHDNYMRVRQLRPLLKDWVDQRVQDPIDGRVPNPEKTLVSYWIKNGALGENFRRKDIVFECFHNFLAFSQWGTTLYNIMARLEATHGDPVMRSWFERVMKSGPDETDTSAFSRLDRFVMELFRTISPNRGSTSALPVQEQPFGSGSTGPSTILTPHLETSRDPLHWNNPNDFDPDRYIQAPTSEQNDETRCKQVGLAQCPFSREAFRVKDGRHASITNSVFGAVYARVGDQAYPVCDDAGYAPFGFGYRRCAGEFLTMGFFKDLLRKVWNEKIAFIKLTIDPAELLPVGPAMVVPDTIGFKRTQ
jgi:cytochrome P450